MPLFNYNINFEGLRSLLERVNIQTNNNSESIGQLKEQLEAKASSQQVKRVPYSSCRSKGSSTIPFCWAVSVRPTSKARKRS